MQKGLCGKVKLILNDIKGHIGHTMPHMVYFLNYLFMTSIAETDTGTPYTIQEYTAGNGQKDQNAASHFLHPTA